MADYKATAAELASIANAIRLKGGTSAALEFPGEWITAIQNLVPASGGSEITPADPTAEYKVTDSELISIANAIRAKGGTSSQLEFPSEFVSAIQNIPAPTPPIEIVSWATGTDAQIAAMIDAAHAGTIDLQQDGGWGVGDVRTISVSAFTGGGASHSAQNIDIVISSFDEYMSCGNVLQFDFKTPISETDRMNNTNSTSGGYGDSEMKLTTLPALANALPEWLRTRLVEFSVLCNPPYASQKTVTGNKLALRSYTELTGLTDKAYSYDSKAEGSQITYYQTSSNRNKGNTYWLRSIYNSNTGTYLLWATNGTSYRGPNMVSDRIAPFGCL